VPNGDAVSNRNGIELDRRAAGGADAGTGMFGQLAQIQIARRDVRPGMHHGDHRLGDVGIAQSGGAQHGARRGAVRSGFDGVAA